MAEHAVLLMLALSRNFPSMLPLLSSPFGTLFLFSLLFLASVVTSATAGKFEQRDCQGFREAGMPAPRPTPTGHEGDRNRDRGPLFESDFTKDAPIVHKRDMVLI